MIHGSGWEGPLSIRKPILFGFSAGITTLSIAWMVRRLPPWRMDRWVNGTFAVCLVVEVLLIVMQQWRGVASHFNRQTPFDANVFSMMGLLIQIITVCLILWTLRGFGRLPCEMDERIALRVGMMLILMACLIGAFMISYGQSRIALGQSPEIFGAHGVLKFLHGVPLHSIQWLIVATWLGRFFQLKEWDRVVMVSLVSVGQVLLTTYAAVQVFAGRQRFDLSWESGSILALAALFTVAACLPILYCRKASQIEAVA